MRSYELLTPDFRVDILYISATKVINHSIIIYNYFCGISNQFLVRLGMHINETLRPKTSHSISELELIINKNGLN